MSTFLVTGGAGFIGSHLCDRLLAEGKRVVAVDDLSRGRIANLVVARGYGKRFTLHNIDVRLEELRTVFERHRPEVVMHLAAQPSIVASLSDPATDASANVMGLLNVLECAAATGTRKVVFAASGLTLYGEPRTLPVKETARSKAQPASPNGLTKAAALEYLDLYRRSRGLDSTALVLGSVYGPRQDPTGEAGVVGTFVSQILAGQSPTIFGDGLQTRDFVFIDDAVHAFSLAAGKGSGAVLNVGTGIETSMERLFEMLAEITGFGGEPGRGPAREGDVRRCALDVGLASRKLGWRPWTELEDGLRSTIEWSRGMSDG
jgi:UDP-glucose 4-epimerase